MLLRLGRAALESGGPGGVVGNIDAESLTWQGAFAEAPLGMLTKKLPETTFSQSLRVAWGLMVLVLASFVAGIAGLYDVQMIPVIALPIGVAAMCCSLFAVLHSGEEVTREYEEEGH